VRTYQDLFYTDKLEKMAQEHKNFSFSLYLSREDTEDTNK